MDPAWDAIIIGSGIGGLSTASILARHGKKVLVLEQHDIPGGFSHTFKRKGFEWDVGVHYVGQVEDPKSLMRRLFDYLTDSGLKWSPIGDPYDRVIIKGETFDFVSGEENLVAELSRHFPNDEKAIREYFKILRSFGTSSGWFFGERSMPPFLQHTVGYLMRRKFLKIAGRTTYDVLSSLTNNQKLIAVLASQCGDYGLPPKQSSFGIHAGLVNHYLKGASYPAGGAGSIHENMLAGIQRYGGQIRLKTEVTRIVAEKGRAVGVQIKTGEILRARKIISGAGARNTYLKLWPENVPLPEKIRTNLQNIRPSMAHVCLYVGLDASDAELGLPKHNIWLYDDFDFDRGFARLKGAACYEPAMTYISFPSAKDSEWGKSHPNRATVQVIAPCPFEWVEKWQNTQWRHRGEGYELFKREWQDALLKKLETAVPQVRGHIAYSELSSPLSTRHFSKYSHGEIYGLEHTPDRLRANWLRAHTPLKNLYLTGQDIVMVGVGGALFSGAVTATSILRRNVLRPILAK